MDSEHSYLVSPGSDSPELGGLVQHLYADLRRMAAGYLRNESNAATLQPTALVHDVFLRMARTGAPGWSSPQEFFERACRVMRQALVDHARGKLAKKRGGTGRSDAGESGNKDAPGLFEQVHTAGKPMAGRLAGDLGQHPPLDVLALDDALTELESFDPHLAQLVQLRFFLGLTIEQSASSLGVSTSKVEADWRLARAWLAGRIKPAE